jgi:hypothetical protein
MKIIHFLSCLLIITACKDSTTPSPTLDEQALQYVRLGLTIGQYDADFVDAYYGPDSLRSSLRKQSAMPKDSLIRAVADLKASVENVLNSARATDTITTRGRWMLNQLTAFDRRIRIFNQEYNSFDEESQELFGVKAPKYDEEHYRKLVSELDKALPGNASIPERFQKLASKFIIPKEKVDTVFRKAIEEARRITLSKMKLPGDESFTLEYVTDKPWSGYNWYKGNYKSVIQINIDLPIYIERAIDLACHEGYPGHHVYNMMLEKNLYRDKGWLEISLYPLYSPQSLIAEGSANYGIEMAFPGIESTRFAREILLPLAGLDTTGTGLYFRTSALRRQLNYARNEAARGILDGTMKNDEVIRWLTQYALMSRESAEKSVSFIKKNRSYVITYNYGRDLVENYIEKKGGSPERPEKRWELFDALLSNPVTPDDLLKD